MATIAFPGFGNSSVTPSIPAGKDPGSTKLRGLSFSVHKRPSFKTKINESVAGNEVRTTYSVFPRWEFDLSYEFLEDRSGAQSSLKTLMGFFTDRKGSFEEWLFKDPDDYLVVNGAMGVSDALTTQFYFNRYLGANPERIGQVDTANTITLYNSVIEPRTVPATPGPYTLTTSNTGFVEDLGVVYVSTGLPLMKVASAPATGQYSVNTSTGVYTFNSAQQGLAIRLNYRYLVPSGNYVVTMPNYVVFTSAPPAGTITADFQFFFVCRFNVDMMDFEKWNDQLWSLQTCSFRSLLQ